MITDRDIAIRAVGQGKGADTKVRDVMTRDVKYCFEEDDVDEVCANMSDIQVRRMPVLNNDKRLVGIISLGDIARREEPEHAGNALQGIAQPGGQHTQSHP
jgi:CBS domain-containing protein